MSACTPSTFGRPNCSPKGELCIELRAEEPIRVGEPIKVNVTVVSETDLPDLEVHLSGYPVIQVLEPTGEEKGVVIKNNPTWVNWSVDLKSKQPLTITRQLVLPKFRIVVYLG